MADERKFKVNITTGRGLKRAALTALNLSLYDSSSLMHRALVSFLKEKPEAMQASRPKNILAVATMKGVGLGCAVIKGEYIYVYVDKMFRSIGIGSALIEDILAVCTPGETILSEGLDEGACKFMIAATSKIADTVEGNLVEGKHYVLIRLKNTLAEDAQGQNH